MLGALECTCDEFGRPFSGNLPVCVLASGIGYLNDKLACVVAAIGEPALDAVRLVARQGQQTNGYAERDLRIYLVDILPAWSSRTAELLS